MESLATCSHTEFPAACGSSSSRSSPARIVLSPEESQGAEFGSVHQHKPRKDSEQDSGCALKHEKPLPASADLPDCSNRMCAEMGEPMQLHSGVATMKSAITRARSERGNHNVR